MICETGRGLGIVMQYPQNTCYFGVFYCLKHQTTYCLIKNRTALQKSIIKDNCFKLCMIPKYPNLQYDIFYNVMCTSTFCKYTVNAVLYGTSHLS